MAAAHVPVSLVRDVSKHAVLCPIIPVRHEYIAFQEGGWTRVGEVATDDAHSARCVVAREAAVVIEEDTSKHLGVGHGRLASAATLGGLIRGGVCASARGIFGGVGAVISASMLG